MLRALLIGVLLLVMCRVHAQEQFGIAHSNYAGTDAVALNPARMATQWPWMDVNITGAGAFVWNDHIYMSGNERSLLGEMRASMRGAQGGRMNFQETLRGGTRHGFANAHIAGPAITVGMGRNSLGAHFSSKAAVSVTGVGNDLARFAYNGLGYTPQHGVRYHDDLLRIVGGARSEFGVSFARLLIARDNTLLSAGITGKYLLAHAGAGLSFNSLDYAVLDTARAEIYDASGVYGYAAPRTNAGHGFGADIGAVYERTLENADGYTPHSACEPMPYRYRIGLSLLDIGGMRFAGGVSGSFNGSTSFFPNYNDVDIDSEEDVDSLLSTSLSTYESGGGFRLGLPTAIAAQYDQRIKDHLYVAADVVQDLAMGEALRLRRPNSVAIVPRYELKYVEAAVPIVMHEYAPGRPTVGLMLRLAHVVIGSDNLLSLLTRGSVYGTDFYFRIKWTRFRSPACRGGGRREHRAGAREPMPCKFPE